MESILGGQVDERFIKLKVQLEQEEWPGVYFFKFIVPNDPKRIALVTALFDEGTDLRMQPSRTNKYISVSAKEMMMNATEVIEKYELASNIEGLIAL